MSDFNEALFRKYRGMRDDELMRIQQDESVAAEELPYLVTELRKQSLWVTPRLEGVQSIAAPAYSPLKATAWIFIGVALCLPILSTVNGGLAPRYAGYVSGGIIFGLGAAGAVAYVLFRKKTDKTKAIASVIMGIGAFVYAAGVVIGDWVDRRNLKDAAQSLRATMQSVEGGSSQSTALSSSAVSVDDNARNAIGTQKADGSARAALTDALNRLAAFNTEKKKKLSVLKEKFENNDFGNALLPARLISKDGIKRSRATVADFEKLIVERDALYSSFASENRIIVSESQFGDTDKAKTLEAYDRNWKELKAILEDISKAQRNILGANTKVLDIAERNLGTIALKDENLLFATQEQLDAYQIQLSNIRQYELEKEKATAAFGVVTQRSQNRREKALQTLQR